jgi:hypothetical protein
MFLEIVLSGALEPGLDAAFGAGQHRSEVLPITVGGPVGVKRKPPDRDQVALGTLW